MNIWKTDEAGLGMFKLTTKL